MTQTFKTWLKRQYGYWPLYLLCVNMVFSIVWWWSVLALPLSLYLLLKGTLDLVQGIGPIYWIAQLDPRWFSIGKGFMHEINHPWRKGRGFYIALCKRRIQIGLCKKHYYDEETGVLSALEGRYLDVEPKEIGTW